MSLLESVELNPGDVIASKKKNYAIERGLGEGGFGSVYLVHDGSEHYALKLTKLFTFLPDERVEYAKRFKQEFEYGSKLKSNYVVKSYDFDVFKGNPFLVMDACPNGSLRDYIDRELKEDELDRIAFGILSGLHDLHSEGIIHRDIKPENVLFDEENRPRLADFGISASVKKRHTVANFMGHAKEVFATGCYSPPEQIDAKRAMKVMGPTNDIYAFAAMMYEVITHGALPFGGFEEFLENIPAYEKKKKEESWDRDLLNAKSPSAKWEDIIAKGLCYRPEDRYQNVREIISELGYELAGSNENYKADAHSQWILKVQNGEEIGRTYHLNNLMQYKGKPVLSLGWYNEEDPFTNDIGITEYFTQFISNYHATLQFNPVTYHWSVKDGQYRTKDGNPGRYPSTNGVFVNGIRMTSEGKTLTPGDIIIIGDTTLKVLLHPAG